MCILNGMTTLTASCQLNLEDWPLDNQTCVFMFGSYTYGIDRMALQQPPARRYEQMLSGKLALFNVLSGFFAQIFPENLDVK